MNNEYQRICALRIKVGEIDLTRRPRVPIIKPSAEKKRPNQGDVFGASEKLEWETRIWELRQRELNNKYFDNWNFINGNFQNDENVNNFHNSNHVNNENFGSNDNLDNKDFDSNNNDNINIKLDIGNL